MLTTFVTGLVWNTVFILAGYGLGENRTAIQAWVGAYQNAVLAAGAAALVWLTATRIARARRRVHGTPADE